MKLYRPVMAGEQVAGNSAVQESVDFDGRTWTLVFETPATDPQRLIDALGHPPGSEFVVSVGGDNKNRLLLYSVSAP